MTDGTERAIAGHSGVPEPSYPVSSVELVTGTGSQEVTMSPSVTTIEEIDLEISVAYIALGSVRGRFERSPNADTARLLEQAQAEVDRLLDERLAARP